MSELLTGDLSRSVFQSPPGEFRPVPFWGWNDALRPEELLWQIRQMWEQGYGGFFIHSRPGLITSYLSDEWFQLVGECVAAGKNLGMGVWLYDEDRWPSGSCGGELTARRPDLRAKGLIAYEPTFVRPGETVDASDAQPVSRLVASYLCRFNDQGELLGVEMVEPSDVIPSVTAPPPGGGKNGDATAIQKRLIHIGLIEAASSPWFNGNAYPDLLDPESVLMFISLTHQRYSESFGTEFGGTIPGIFVDEPNLLEALPRGTVPWTPNLAAYFKKKRGYDPMPFLPWLWWDGPQAPAIRNDFWSSVSELFDESFFSPLRAWCQEHHMRLAGHLLLEDRLGWQVMSCGAAMPKYEYMDIPGVDHLGRNIDDHLALKQVASVARQLGKNRILSELSGASGHNLTFEDQKWIADWHLAHGVNFFTPHEYLHSMRGCRKRDYPPALGHQQPYWPFYRLINDYLARGSYILSQGDSVADILLLNPVATAWVLYSPKEADPHRWYAWDAGPRLNSWQDSLERLSLWLGELHYDYDLGDETILGAHAHVQGNCLVVGQQRYRAVIIPPSLNWSEQTVALLREFVAHGGCVVNMKPQPSLVGGRGIAPGNWDALLASEGASGTMQTIPLEKDALATCLEGLGSFSRISVTSRATVANEAQRQGTEVAAIRVDHRRLKDGGHLYFLANTDRRHAYEVQIRLPLVEGTAHIEEWDLTSGKVVKVKEGENLADAADGSMSSISARFEPTGSKVFMVKAEIQQPKSVLVPASLCHSVGRSYELASSWHLERRDPNCLVLDSCRYRIREGSWQGPLPVWKAQEEIQQEFSLPSTRTNRGVQFWKEYQATKRLSERDTIDLCFEFSSRIEFSAPSKVFLGLETPDNFTKIRINGETVSLSDTGYWVDKSLRKLDMTDYVRSGVNRIELSCRPYRQDIEVENVFILGDFAVWRDGDGGFVLGQEPENLINGSWVEQGYPFYCGTMVYSQRTDLRLDPVDPAERVYLRLIEPYAAVVNVTVGDEQIGPIGWPPWEAELTTVWQRSRRLNEVAIEVVSTLRNAFGPFHHQEGDLHIVTPVHFSDEGNWTDKYSLVPYGLLGGAEIVTVSNNSAG